MVPAQAEGGELSVRPVGRFNRVWLVTAILIAFFNERALGCAVCFGDPESGMAKGVVAGVWVMIGFVGFVLAGFVGTGLFWLQRSRSLARSLPYDSTAGGR
jgi:hypothetical protein